MEHFINSDIDELIEYLFFEQEEDAIQQDFSYETTNESVRKQACKQFISETVTFLNPDKVIDALWKMSAEMVKQFSLPDTDYSFQTNVSIHCSSMLERILLKQPLNVSESEKAEAMAWEGYPALHEFMQQLGAIFQLTIPIAEEYYLSEMIRYRR